SLRNSPLTLLPTLFPYTTLFRSSDDPWTSTNGWRMNSHLTRVLDFSDDAQTYRLALAYQRGGWLLGQGGASASFEAANDGADRRSEELTSELQSRVDLVCRLLLE